MKGVGSAWNSYHAHSLPCFINSYKGTKVPCTKVIHKLFDLWIFYWYFIPYMRALKCPKYLSEASLTKVRRCVSLHATWNLFCCFTLTLARVANRTPFLLEHLDRCMLREYRLRWMRTRYTRNTLPRHHFHALSILSTAAQPVLLSSYGPRRTQTARELRSQVSLVQLARNSFG